MKSIKQQCLPFETVQQILKLEIDANTTRDRANVSNLVKSIKKSFTIYETVQLILKHEIDANTTRDQANVWNPLNNSALPFETVQQILKLEIDANTTRDRANVSNLVKSIKQQCFTLYETVQQILAWNWC